MKMKLSNLALLGGFAILFAGGVILSSCEGPMGPAGPPGQDGVDGVDGVDGTDGTDGVAGNAVCLECHTTAIKAAKMDEWELSGHGIGAATSRGSRTSCARCHSHEGFVETVWTGQTHPETAPVYPQKVQCKTCHDFHSTDMNCGH